MAFTLWICSSLAERAGAVTGALTWASGVESGHRCRRLVRLLQSTSTETPAGAPRPTWVSATQRPCRAITPHTLDA